MPSDDPRFNCPACGKSYRWKPEMAGRSAKCGCGGKLVVPAERPASPSNGAANAPKLAPPPAPAPVAPQARPALLSPRPVRAASSSGLACPWCAKPLPEGAVLCVNCGYNLKTKQRIAVVVEKVEVDDDDSAADQPPAAAAASNRPSPPDGQTRSGG